MPGVFRLSSLISKFAFSCSVFGGRELSVAIWLRTNLLISDIIVDLVSLSVGWEFIVMGPFVVC